MGLVRARQPAVVTMQSAERVIGIEVPVVREPLVQDGLKAIVTTLGSSRPQVAQSHQRLEMKTAARVADDVGLVTCGVYDTCVLDCFVNILIRISKPKHVVPTE